MTKIKNYLKFCFKYNSSISLNLKEENMLSTITTLIIITVVVIIGDSGGGFV